MLNAGEDLLFKTVNYTHFILLDQQAWLAWHQPAALAGERSLILKNSAPGAKSPMRSASERLEFLPHEARAALRLFPELTRSLRQQEQAGASVTLRRQPYNIPLDPGRGCGLALPPTSGRCSIPAGNRPLIRFMPTCAPAAAWRWWIAQRRQRLVCALDGHESRVHPRLSGPGSRPASHPWIPGYAAPTRASGITACISAANLSPADLPGPETRFPVRQPRRHEGAYVATAIDLPCEMQATVKDDVQGNMIDNAGQVGLCSLLS